MYKVLLVEDDSGYIMLYKHMEAWEKCGFAIADTAYHGEEALRKLEKADFDLIFTDIRMPIKDGVELTKTVRQKGYKDIPVIFASSHSDFGYAQQGIVHGLFDYILKPVDEKTLENVLNRVKEHLTGKNANKVDHVISDLLADLGIPASNDDFVFQISAYCTEHYKEPFVLGDFAEIFGYNTNYFSRLFRSHFNMTFKEFAGRVKVAYAIEYLRLGQFTVADISEKLGFQNIDYFRELFKSVTGDTPINYKFGMKGEEDR